MGHWFGRATERPTAPPGARHAAQDPQRHLDPRVGQGTTMVTQGSWGAASTTRRRRLEAVPAPVLAADLGASIVFLRSRTRPWGPCAP
jgi:hypothetical protein